ncbi:MAG: DMT family transporter [Eubacterium sp.]|nr:DMT family transporter [Candidatus Colimonas fimequi]
MNDKVMKNVFASITILFWSLAFPLTKVAAVDLSSFTIGAVRCTVAAIVLLAIGKAMHIRKPFRRSHLALFAAEGMMGFSLYMIFFNTGMQTLTSATSSLILALTPTFTALGAWKVFGERLKGFGWFCMGTAFVGVCILLFWDGDFSMGVGALWTVSAVILFAGYNLLNRKLTHMGYNAVEIVTYAMCFGALFLWVFAPRAVSELQSASGTSIFVCIFLGVTASAIAYFTWSQAFARAEKLTEVTNFMYVTPVLASIEGGIILGEMPNGGTFIGGAIILASVIAFGIRGK